MDGTTDAFLETAQLAAVAATLLDARPAFVFAPDGSRLLFANAAACAFLDLPGIEAALTLHFSRLNPIRALAARLTRLAPANTPRLEMLRFALGVGVTTLPAACLRLNYGHGGEKRALLAVGAVTVASESLAARAERFVDALQTKERLAAIIGNDGRVLAASPDYVSRGPSESDVAELLSAAKAADTALAIRELGAGRAPRIGGALRFTADGRELTLVIAGMAETAMPDAIAVGSDAMTEAAGLEVDADLMLPELEAEEQPPEPPNEAAAEAVAPLENEATDANVPATTSGEPPAAESAGKKDVTRPPFPGEPDEATILSAMAPEAVQQPRLPASEQAREPSAIDADEAAQHSIERGAGRRPRRSRGAEEQHDGDLAPPQPPAAETRLEAVPGEPSNVVHLPAVDRAAVDRLSGTERDAFRRIAEALGARQPPHAAAEAEPAPPSRKEIVKAPVSEIDTRLLDRLPIGIAIFRDRRTLFANRTLIDMLGYDSFAAFIDAGGAEAIFPGREAIAGSIVEAGGRLRAQRRDGAGVPVQAWLHAVNFGGATALMLSLDANIGGDTGDEDAIAMARLEAHAEELEAILDTATDGVLVLDGHGKIDRMNRAAEALFGVKAADYAGRYFTDLVADESQKAVLDYLDGLKENGVASVLNDGREVIGRVPQGGLIPLFMTMGRIGSSDKFCAVLSDITHWKNVEAELIAARRSAEAANAQKSEFLAKISHEIRTPLNAIIGFSEVMMGERFGPIGNQRYRDYLHDIHVSGAHLLSLINDLLDLSKIEAGKVELTFGSVPVNGAIQECVALMQPLANRERIIIRTSLSADVPNVVADERSLRQILLNIMSNAVKFTRAGGQVIVSSSLEASGEVVVRVRDTGIGMSEKDLETALKPFRQVSASDRDQGTGLGLPLTKALVEANRAMFAIESTPGQGTLVKVTFPTTRVLAG
ncbi:MAG TPA: ATP-binding protein [Bauldia sp.]|nr:ATP-binding protein [Bauldia sp.]